MLSLVAGVRWVEVDDEAVVYLPGRELFVDLDRSAAELWLVLVESDWSGSAAVDHLVDGYGMEVDEATALVESYLEDLARHGLLLRRPPEDEPSGAAGRKPAG